MPFRKKKQNINDDLKVDSSELLKRKRPSSHMSNSRTAKCKRSKLKSFASKRLSVQQNNFLANKNESLFTKEQLRDLIHHRNGMLIWLK